LVIHVSFSTKWKKSNKSICPPNGRLQTNQFVHQMHEYEQIEMFQELPATLKTEVSNSAENSVKFYEDVYIYFNWRWWIKL